MTTSSGGRDDDDDACIASSSSENPSKPKLQRAREARRRALPSLPTQALLNLMLIPPRSRCAFGMSRPRARARPLRRLGSSVRSRPARDALGPGAEHCAARAELCPTLEAEHGCAPSAPYTLCAPRQARLLRRHGGRRVSAPHRPPPARWARWPHLLSPGRAPSCSGVQRASSGPRDQYSPLGAATRRR